MAFCPECGKSAAAEATRCVHCGHGFEDKQSAGKPGARFKGTMMMTGPAVNAAPAAAAPAAAATPAAMATANTPVAPAPAAAEAPAVARKPAAAKATMIGTGLNAGAIAAAKAAAGIPAAKAAAGSPVAQAARPVAAAAPVAAPVSDNSKRNLALAQTQLGTGLPAAAAPRAAPAAAPVATPAPVDPPVHSYDEPAEEEEEPDSEAREQKYLPGDPMAPHAHAAERAPMLRYDDSITSLPRHNPFGDRKFIWIAGGVIGFLCLILLIVLASKLAN